VELCWCGRRQSRSFPVWINSSKTIIFHMTSQVNIIFELLNSAPWTSESSEPGRRQARGRERAEDQRGRISTNPLLRRLALSQVPTPEDPRKNEKESQETPPTPKLNLCRPQVPRRDFHFTRHGGRLLLAGSGINQSTRHHTRTQNSRRLMDWANPSLTSSMAGSPYRDLCCYGAGIAG
jgi:hypothetical protein